MVVALHILLHSHTLDNIDLFTLLPFRSGLPDVPSGSPVPSIVWVMVALILLHSYTLVRID
jgi:hypothetical protein